MRREFKHNLHSVHTNIDSGNSRLVQKLIGLSWVRSEELTFWSDAPSFKLLEMRPSTFASRSSESICGRRRERVNTRKVTERTSQMMHNSSLFDPMRAFCNPGKCRTTPRRLSICVTREEAVRAEQASRVSFEASYTSLEKNGNKEKMQGPQYAQR